MVHITTILLWVFSQDYFTMCKGERYIKIQIYNDLHSTWEFHPLGCCSLHHHLSYIFWMGCKQLNHSIAFALVFNAKNSSWSPEWQAYSVWYTMDAFESLLKEIYEEMLDAFNNVLVSCDAKNKLKNSLNKYYQWIHLIAVSQAWEKIVNKKCTIVWKWINYSVDKSIYTNHKWRFYTLVQAILSFICHLHVSNWVSLLFWVQLFHYQIKLPQVLKQVCWYIGNSWVVQCYSSVTTCLCGELNTRSLLIHSHMMQLK